MIKTLQLFVPNSKRLGGYTQWVHFFFEKAHITKRLPQRRPFQDITTKKPGTSHIRVLFDKTSTNSQNNFKTRSSSSLFQIARGSGATTRWMYFFSSEKHSPLKDLKKCYKVSLQKALGWHLVPTQQDLKEQSKTFRAQPWSARGLVDAGPIGYPAREREDLVQLRFFPCNLSSITIK